MTAAQVLDVYHSGTVLESNEACSAFAAAHATGGSAPRAVAVAVEVEVVEDHSIPKVLSDSFCQASMFISIIVLHLDLVRNA